MVSVDGKAGQFRKPTDRDAGRGENPYIPALDNVPTRLLAWDSSYGKKETMSSSR